MTIHERCSDCGGPLDEHRTCIDKTGIHRADVPDTYDPPPPPPPPEKQLPLPRYPVGTIIHYDWPGGGVIPMIVTSTPDTDGKIGLMILQEHKRVHQEDTERIT